MPRARGVRRRARGAAVEFMAPRISDAANIPRGSVTPLQRGVVALRPTGAHDEPRPAGRVGYLPKCLPAGPADAKKCPPVSFCSLFFVLYAVEYQSFVKKLKKVFDA